MSARNQKPPVTQTVTQTDTRHLLIRQGDILLIPTSEAIPAGLRRVERESGRVVLAYGETTGHAHAILDPEVELFRPDPDTITGTETADAADAWLKVRRAGGTTLVHEEHGALPLAVLTHRVRQQREYFPDAIRQVAD